MKKILSYLLAGLVVTLFTIPASAEIEWKGKVAAGVENVEGDDPETDESLQFTNALVNLDLKAEVADGITAVVESTVLAVGVDIVEVDVMAVELSNLIPNATLIAGKLEFPFGKEADTDVMTNPMIENSALKVRRIEGIEGIDIGITGKIRDYGLALKTTMGAVNCLLAITNGNEGAGSDNNSDKQMAIRLDGNVPAIPGLSLAASYLTNDAAGNNEPTNEETRMVFDASYAVAPCAIGVTYGKREIKIGIPIDEAILETLKVELDGWAIEGKYAITDACSVALRYSKLEGEISARGIDISGEMTKLQVGINYKLAENALLKLEYVDNNLKEKPTDRKDDNDYDGIKAAVALAF